MGPPAMAVHIPRGLDGRKPDPGETSDLACRRIQCFSERFNQTTQGVYPTTVVCPQKGPNCAKNRSATRSSCYMVCLPSRPATAAQMQVKKALLGCTGGFPEKRHRLNVPLGVPKVYVFDPRMVVRFRGDVTTEILFPNCPAADQMARTVARFDCREDPASWTNMNKRNTRALPWF